MIVYGSSCERVDFLPGSVSTCYKVDAAQRESGTSKLGSVDYLDLTVYPVFHLDLVQSSTLERHNMLCPSESWVNLDDPPCPYTDAVIPSSPTMRSTSLICPTPRSSIFYNSILQQFEQPISFPSFIPSQYLNIHNAGFFSPNTSVLHSDYPNFTSNCTDTNDLPSMFLLESRHVFPSHNHTFLPADTSGSMFPNPCDMSLPAGTTASQTSISREFITALSPPHFMSVTICSEPSLSQTSLGFDVSSFQPLPVDSTCSLDLPTISQTSLSPDFDDSTFQPLPIDSECSLDETAISQILLGTEFDDSTFQPLPIDSECSLDETAISQILLGTDFDDSTFQPLPIDSECSLDETAISQILLGTDFDDSTFQPLPIDSECSLDETAISQILLGTDFDDSTFQPLPIDSECSLDETAISQILLGTDFDDSTFQPLPIDSESSLDEAAISQILLGPDFDDSTFQPLPVDSACSLDETISQMSLGHEFEDSTFRKLHVDSACSLDQASISQTSLGPEFEDSTFRKLQADSACTLDQASISQTSLGPEFEDATFSSECNLSQDYSQTLMKSIFSPVPGSSGSSLSQTNSQVSSIDDFSESILITYSFQL